MDNRMEVTIAVAGADECFGEVRLLCLLRQIGYRV